MKINAVKGLCKDHKAIYVFNGGEEFGAWVSDGYGTYKLDDINGAPDSEDLAVFFDVPEKDRRSYSYKDCELPGTYNFGDTDVTENAIEPYSLTVTFSGVVLTPVLLSDGLYFVPNKCLKPIEDGATWYERRTSSGAAYIAIKSGMFLRAVIMPYKLTRKLADMLCDLADRARATDAREDQE